MIKKKLSIITICYNEPDVEKTCESIVNQTWQDFEWIVIDGGSNKETLDVFEKYKDKIDIFVSEPDNGIYNACNKGIDLSKGKFIIFMNAGDTFYSLDVLKSVKDFLEEDGKVIYGLVQLEKTNKNKKIKAYPDNLSNEFWLTNNICTQSVFIPRILFEQYGKFDESYKIIADYCKWLDFEKNGVEFKYCPVVVSTFNLNGVSSNKKNKRNYIIEKNRARYKYFKKEDIDSIEKKYNRKLTGIKKFFSINNNFYRTHKIITILGYQIKIKRSI